MNSLRHRKEKEQILSFSFIVSALVLLTIGLFTLTAFNSALRRLQKKDVKKKLSATGKLFFYQSIHQFFFPHLSYEGIFFASTSAQNLLRFFYATFSILFLVSYGWVFSDYETSVVYITWPYGILSLIGFFLLFFAFADYLARLLGNRYPQITLTTTAFLSSIFMMIVFPLTLIFLKLSELVIRGTHFDVFADPQAEETKQEIIDLIEESSQETQLDSQDKQLIESVMDFKDRIAREIMVPRVDVFSLPHDITIAKAGEFLINEGYSRTPVYQDTLDNIIGVLMYKDIFAKYMESKHKNDPSILEAPIASLVKNVLYTPETKKISHLLQEFRKKQVHLAIIVDEYGGTEGIVTIEDILEEIVGDIADEYDKEESLFFALPEGGWIVDARMTIPDIEEQLGVEILQEGDYDTLGGYIFHQTGTIPDKGFIIQKPNFELEVLRSNDRRVEKVRIRPLTLPQEHSQNSSKE